MKIYGGDIVVESCAEKEKNFTDVILSFKKGDINQVIN